MFCSDFQGQTGGLQDNTEAVQRSIFYSAVCATLRIERLRLENVRSQPYIDFRNKSQKSPHRTAHFGNVDAFRNFVDVQHFGIHIQRTYWLVVIFEPFDTDIRVGDVFAESV